MNPFMFGLLADRTLLNKGVNIPLQTLPLKQLLDSIIGCLGPRMTPLEQKNGMH
jgi:hypothetical protein